MKLIHILIGLVLLISFNPGLAKPAQNPPLTIVLDWFVNPDHAPLLVAEQHGFFAEQAIAVKIIAPADPADGPKLVAAKQADVAITSQPQLVLQVAAGLPLVRFGTLVPTPLNCLVSLKTSHIEKITDLKGKSIGYSSGAIDNFMLQVMLSRHGLKLNDVTLINVRYDLMQALLSNNITAFTGAMRNIEPIQLRQAGLIPQVFYPEDNGFPSYEELIYVTHRDHLQDKRLIAFLKAVQSGQQYLMAHPHETWQEAIKKYPELNNSLNEAAWLASINLFAKDPAHLDAARYQQLAEFMKHYGLIKTIPATTDYAVQLF